jgi:hypothetical protein
MTISNAFMISVVYGLGFFSGTMVTVGLLMIWMCSSDFGRLIQQRKQSKTTSHNPSA